MLDKAFEAAGIVPILGLRTPRQSFGALDKKPFIVDQIGGYEAWYAMYQMAMTILGLRPKKW